MNTYIKSNVRNPFFYRHAFTFVLMPTIFFLLSFAGCAGMRSHSPQITTYTLEYPPPKKTGTALAATIGIFRFSVAPEYDTQAVVYREKNYVRQEYAYHSWRANPGLLVSSFLARDLTHSGLFSAVTTTRAGVKPVFSLEGRVLDFYELDLSDRWQAVLRIVVTLVDDRTPDPAQQVLFQREYEARIDCAQKTPSSLVEAMSQAMFRVSAQVLDDIQNGIAARLCPADS